MDVLVQKTVFSSEFTSGDTVQIQNGEMVQNGLIIDNFEDSLLVAVVHDLIKSEDIEKGIETIEINVSDIRDGGTSLQKTPQVPTEPRNIKEIYQAYKELSTLLCNQEHVEADKNEVINQEDIDLRHEERMNQFVSLLH